MKLSALICWIGAVCILLAACQPISPPPPPAPPPPVAQTCNHTSSGSDFVSAKVFLLSASFDPKLYYPPGPSDIIRQAVSTDPYWNDISGAFTAANDSLKDKLCSLDGVFVVQSTCKDPACIADDVIGHSWGFRQPTSPPKRYIAVSETLWQNGSAPIFSDFENMRLAALLKRLIPNGAVWFNVPSSRPRFGPASPDTSAMTLLAVLAHEYGHVYWYDAFVSPPGGSFRAARFCGGRFYTANKWGSIGVPPTGRWIEFGQQLGNQLHNPDYIGTLANHLSHADFGQAGSALRAILLDQDLISTLASFSPIEDFVESYEWFALLSANPPLTKFTIQIDNLPPINILGQIANKPGLRRKMACF